MDIMDKIGKATTQTCRITVTKTNKMAKRAKLKMCINECKDEIQEEYKTMGQKIYEKHVREEDINIKNELEENCKRIDELSKKIENSIEHILALKNMKKCPQCYSEIMISYNFCPVCGKKQNDDKKREEKIIAKLQDEHINENNIKEAEIVKAEKSDD